MHFECKFTVLFSRCKGLWHMPARLVWPIISLSYFCQRIAGLQVTLKFLHISCPGTVPACRQTSVEKMRFLLALDSCQKLRGTGVGSLIETKSERTQLCFAQTHPRPCFKIIFSVGLLYYLWETKTVLIFAGVPRTAEHPGFERLHWLPQGQLRDLDRHACRAKPKLLAAPPMDLY